MRSFTILMAIAFVTVPAHVAAQDYSDLDSSIKEFKGLSEEVVKKNPLLNTGATAISASKGGVDSILSGLGIKKPAPVMETPTIRLSKEQQAIVDREMAKKAKAEASAAKPGAASLTAKPKPASTRKASPVVAVAPPPPASAKPEPKRVTEESARKVAEGMDREQLVASLGPPKTASAISGLEGGTRETLTYELESGQLLFVKILGGKVRSVTR